jgi:hypothetical protein
MKNKFKDNTKKYCELSSHFIKEYAYKHGDEIYTFMDKYDIGCSTYGKMMDAIGRAKNTVAHRLYGHHLIFDFPYASPQNIPAFIEHEFSDLFTKMGLPILPGELIENTPLLKYCNKLTKNWNFINGFDLLSGTIAIWQGIERTTEAFNYELSIDTFSDFARTFGIGTLEFAIAISSANPLLLIAASLHLTSGIRALFNDGSTILFRKNLKSILMEFSLDSLNINKYIEFFTMRNELSKYSINNELIESSLKNEIEKYSIGKEF